jgi:hypothetical protein
MEREPLSTNAGVTVLNSQAWLLSGDILQKASATIEHRLWTMDKARKLLSAK